MPEQQQWTRVIFHIDMDSFYASCELAKDPSFKEKPFVVGADPRGGEGRGVVLSCNYPARAFGIRSGIPISRAWRLCPAAKYVPPDFKLYGEVSGRLMEILRGFSNKVEQVSIDEAYVDMSSDTVIASTSGVLKDNAIKEIASAIKGKIREKERISCSIGVSNSKIVSKIASDFKKPDGLTIVRPEHVEDFLSPLAVEKIPGIGKVSQRILLEKFAIKTISDLKKTGIEDLRAVFGRSGLWMMNVASGIDHSEVISRWDPISQSGETTFDDDEGNYLDVAKVMSEVAEDVTKRTLNDGYLFRTIGIKIRFTGFETHTRSKTLEFVTDSIDVVKKECERQLSEFSSSGKKVRLIGVRLSGLEKKRIDQLTLLDWASPKSKN